MNVWWYNFNKENYNNVLNIDLSFLGSYSSQALYFRNNHKCDTVPAAVECREHINVQLTHNFQVKFE